MAHSDYLHRPLVSLVRLHQVQGSCSPWVHSEYRASFRWICTSSSSSWRGAPVGVGVSDVSSWVSTVLNAWFVVSAISITEVVRMPAAVCSLVTFSFTVVWSDVASEMLGVFCCIQCYMFLMIKLGIPCFSCSAIPCCDVCFSSVGGSPIPIPLPSIVLVLNNFPNCIPLPVYVSIIEVTTYKYLFVSAEVYSFFDNFTNYCIIICSWRWSSVYCSKYYALLVFTFDLTPHCFFSWMVTSNGDWVLFHFKLSAYKYSYSTSWCCLVQSVLSDHLVLPGVKEACIYHLTVCFCLSKEDKIRFLLV